MKKRWLFIDSAKSFGGHEVMLLRWIREIERLGLLDARLLARPDNPLSEEGRAFLCRGASLPPSVPARSAWRLPGAGLIRGALDSVRIFLAIRRAVREEAPELCVVATGNLSYLTTVLATRLTGRPTVVYVPLVDTFTTMGYRRSRLKDWVVRNISSRIPHAWVTITAEQAQSFAAWAGLRSPILCLPNTVAPAIEAKHIAPIAPEDGAFHAPLRVLLLGRLDAHQKGLDYLIDYLDSASLSPGDIHFSIIGEGPYGEELRRRVSASVKLGALISLQVWGDTVETMSAHDVLLLPSRFEGVPLVMLEAMALGLPIVASRLPATHTYLPEACLFEIGDMEMAMKRLAALRSVAVRNTIAAHNHQTFVTTSSGHAFSLAVQRLVRELPGGTQEDMTTGASGSPLKKQQAHP